MTSFLSTGWYLIKMDHKLKSNNFDIVKNSALANFSGFVIRLGARLPFLFVVAFLYGKENFGQYLFAVTCVETLTVVFLFGFKRSLFQFLDDPTISVGREKLNNIIIVAIILSISIGFVVLTSIYILHSFFGETISDPMLSGLLILLPTSLLYSVAEILLTATRAVKIVRYEVAAKSIIEPYSLTILSVIFFYAGFSEYGLFIAYWLMNISVFCYTIYIYWKTIAFDSFRLNFRSNPYFIEFGTILKRSFPVAIDDLLMVLMLRVDIYFLAVLTMPEMLGIYGICLQIITIVKKIKQSFDPILEPVIANSIKIENLSNVANELARVSNLIFWIQSMIFTLLLFYGDEILLLFDIEEPNASLTLLLLISSVVVSGAFGLSELIFLNKKPTTNFYISTITLLIHVVLCYLLIPEFGILGAGLSMAISYGLRSFIQLYLMKRIYRVLPLNSSILVSVGGCIILYVYLFLINNVLDISPAFSIVFGVVGGLMIYLSYGYFIKLINNKFSER